MTISVSHLTKKYGTQKAVDNISFEVQTGEIVGFIGPNGAGKSTTMKVLTGFLSDFEGNVFVDDMEVTQNNIAIKKKIGYLPEHNPLYVDMYIREYLRFVAKIYGAPHSREYISRIISTTGLEKEQHKKIAQLSKGYRQRVGLASVLLHDPDVLILDEPTTGLDPNQIVEIRTIIERIGKEKTVMLSTHIMQEVEAICSRVIIINNGQIVANNDSQSIKSDGFQKHATVLVEFVEECSREQLLRIPDVLDVVSVDAHTWLLQQRTEKDIRKNIFKYAVDENLTVISMQIQEKTLEQAFYDLTKKS
ncbi:MAG: gliding motility-associated ABC transporter ATP-binding subunit GldA [Bacteroidales bacterium]